MTPPTSFFAYSAYFAVNLFRAVACCFLLAAIFLADRAHAVSPWTLVINTNNVVNALTFGAVGNGVTTNTTAIQNAINAAAAGPTTNGAPGGTVEIPPGVYMCGPLTLKSSINLQLDAGALLRMLPLGQYPGGVTNPANFISGSSLHDIEISGSGAIDGQGAPWWPYADTNGAVRPIMIRLTSCNREMIRDVTLSNSPEFHISISGSSAKNTTVQHVTIRANPSSDPVHPGHNTDACDVSGTNILVQDCDISVGDDNFTCGGNTSDILITNNTYGYGHGVSIGSFTSPSVSNMLVINCTFNNTDQGIRIKTDRDRGGYVHNIKYYNLSMTNVMRPILIYCQYTNTTSAYRAVDSISPGVAAGFPSNAVISTTPHYADITISNLTATVQSGRTAGLIWGLPESCVSNVTLMKLKITADKTFGIYDAKNVQIIDSQITTPSSVRNISFFNADVTITNSTMPANSVSLDGADTNGIGSTLSFYSTREWLINTNALDDSPNITLANSTLTVSNNLLLDANSLVTFVLGTNLSTLSVTGNLANIGSIKAIAGSGFTNGTYRLFTYGNTLNGWGPPALTSAPAGYSYSYDTNTAGQVKLVATLLPPTNLVATASNLLINLKWNAVNGATSYNLKRGSVSGTYPTIFGGLITTNFSDADVTNGAPYFYVVSAVGAGGESSNSPPVTATPLPSNQPTNIITRANGNSLQLSWPQDHLGWRLQVQTNSLVDSNWVDVPNSTNVNNATLNIDPANSSVYFRLVYP
jgi:polygalacturonase